MGLGNDVLIGLDAGASRVQAVAFAPDGEELGCATAVAEVHHVADGGIEQDLGAAWQAAAAALRGLAGGCRIWRRARSRSRSPAPAAAPG
jgi:sugar (pentulose or hexulose) kinase